MGFRSVAFCDICNADFNPGELITDIQSPYLTKSVHSTCYSPITISEFTTLMEINISERGV